MLDYLETVPHTILIFIVILIYLISISTSIIFSYRASRTLVSIIEIVLYAAITVIGSILAMIFISYLYPTRGGMATVWGSYGFSTIFLINGIVCLIMFLRYGSKNPQNFVYNNEINFEAGPIFGAIFGFTMFGIAMTGGDSMGVLEQIIPESVKGLIPFLIIISPLVLGIVIAIKSRKWMLNLMTYVVRKNLPEEVRTKLVENNED